MRGWCSGRVKKGAVLILAAALLAVAGGCKKESEKPVQSEQEVSEEAASGIVIEDKEETYTFTDVYGNYYEADLLEDVPLCAYDYDRLTEENGFKYYLDENGEKLSRPGIDVSEYQTEVDWNQVKDSGIEFAMIRLGYRGYGEAGTLVEDAMYRKHIEGALEAGLEVGVYFFSQAVNKEEVLEEAEFVLERIRDYNITCPVVFDTEEIKFDTARTDHLTPQEFTDHCIMFCDAVKKAGYETMIYANMKWMAFTLELERLAGYEKWYADYEPVPQCPYEISMWQYTETGSVPGVQGNVDINVWFP